MDRNVADIGWTEEQWDRVMRTVSEEARAARVAASFMSVSGPLDPTVEAIPPLTLGTQQVPAPLGAQGHGGHHPPQRLWVETDPTLHITTLSTLVYLRGVEVSDPDLSAALGMFRRAANLIARAEDALVFRGRPGTDQRPDGIPGNFAPTLMSTGRGATHGLIPFGLPVPGAGAAPVHNPVVLPAPGAAPPPGPAAIGNRLPIRAGVPQQGQVLPQGAATGASLVAAVVAAITALEGQGYNGPYACVLNNDWFTLACSPAADLVLPRDRILPFVEGRLYRSSTLPEGYGLLLDVGGAPSMEIVLAGDIQVKFLQISTEPRYVFRVSERVAFRLREEPAVALLWT